MKPALYQPRIRPNGISLRPMQDADTPVFRQLFAEVRAPELQAVPWSDAQKQAFCDSQYSAQDYHYRKYYEDFEPWAICDGDTVIGRLVFSNFNTLLVLMDITISSARRGHGIGSALLADIVQQADENGRTLSLQVEPDNPARRLYQRLGFIEVSAAEEKDSSEIYLDMRRMPTPKTQSQNGN